MLHMMHAHNLVPYLYTDHAPRVPGAPIGDYCNQFISRKHQAALALLSTLEEIGSLDPQVALALLRLCSGFFKLIHIAMVTPPHLILNAMQLYDADIHHSFAH